MFKVRVRYPYAKHFLASMSISEWAASQLVTMTTETVTRLNYFSQLIVGI